jgi:hypothetical protein
MTKAEQKDLDREVGKASNDYLALRDAKSNGCLSGKTLFEVLAYDALIEASFSRLQDLNNRLIASYDQPLES